MKKIPRMTAAVLLIALLLSLAGCGASDGKTHLTFQIWDTAQRKGMEQMCDAYTAQHPDVVIDVQVVSWNEYWTKLEAAAESNTMPDIFWMHTNQLLYYADFGMLADVTNLYDDVESGYYQNHFSDISLSNVSGSDGRYYGVFTWLAPWAALIDLLLSVLAFLFVLYLVTKQDEGTYKILWLLRRGS